MVVVRPKCGIPETLMGITLVIGIIRWGIYWVEIPVMPSKGIEGRIVHTGQDFGNYLFAFRTFDFKAPGFIGAGFQFIAKNQGLDFQIGFG